MRELLHGLTFKRRIWIAMVLLVTFSIAVTSTISYSIAAREMEGNAFRLSQNTLNKSADVLDENLKKILVSVLAVMISPPFTKMMEDASAKDSSEYYSHLSGLQIPFTQLKITESSIDSVLVSTPIGEFYHTSERRQFHKKLEDTDMFKEYKQQNQSFWSSEHEDELFSQRKQVISLIMEPVKDVPVNDVYMVVNIRADHLGKLIGSTIGDAGGSTYLIHTSGSEVLQVPPPYQSLFRQADFLEHVNESDTGYFMQDHLNEQLLINFSSMATNENWKLINVHAKKELMQQIEGIRWAAIAVAAGCLIVAILLSNWLTGLLLRPLFQLQSLIKQVGLHNLQPRFQSPYRDEVAQVGYKFNSMLDELTELIEANRQVEREKRLAEVKALQAQINPHFLYNTLNSVFWRCLDNEYDEAKHIVMSLSGLFQLGLNKGLEMTTLKKEIEHVEHYLKIQQMCYVGLFTYDVVVRNEDALEKKILKVILQPLVENCILHGFKDMEEGGHISIVVDGDDDGLIIQVVDNGSGMDAEQVGEALSGSQTADKKSYALHNVQERLRLYYGDQSRLELYSDSFSRTSVTLAIPYTFKEGEELA
jgi:two-component system sensor histidine kinase YesM